MADLDIRAEVRAMDRAMAKMIEKAKAAGIENPMIYFEAEGHVYVIDTDHPGYKNDGGPGRPQQLALRQEAAVASGYLRSRHDVGAW